jgi:transcription-repair coupling factor (superfamily II helicase)
VSVGDKISIDFINEVLFEYEFKRVDFITEPGEFSVRGGIVDVFSFRMIIRTVSSFGDEVESIRSFDVDSCLSKSKKKITKFQMWRTKFFRKIEKVSWIIFQRKRCCLFKIPKTFFAVRQAICEGRRSF